MDWGYVSGYFDGEGHVNLSAPPSRPQYRMLYLSWANTHKASLEAIRDFIGCGIIHPGDKKGRNKPMFNLVIATVVDMLRIGEAMLPHLIVKREAVQELLAWARDNRSPRPKTWGLLTVIGVPEITRLYHEEGLTQQQIADRLGVSPSGVSTFFMRNGINGRRRGPAEGAYGLLTQYGYDKIHAMYEQGMTKDEIAKEVGVNPKTVYMHFYTRGIKLTKPIRRARAARRDPDNKALQWALLPNKHSENVNKLVGIPKEHFVRWYSEEGQSVAEIAARLGVTGAGIYRILKVHGIPLRPVKRQKKAVVLPPPSAFFAEEPLSRKDVCPRPGQDVHHGPPTEECRTAADVQPFLFADRA